jgi:hypothetical protein
VRHLPRARLSRIGSRLGPAALTGLRGLGAWWRSPPRYTVTLDHAGQSRTLEMDTRAAARAARRFERRADGAIAYEFAPGRHGYVVQRGNPTRFDRPHPVSAFPPRPGDAVLRVRAEGIVAADEGARLYLIFHGAAGRLASFSLGLRGELQAASFRAPPGAGSAALALRLAGAGTLPPLALSYRLEPDAAAAGAAAPAAAVADFDRLALLAGGAASRIAGVHDFEDARLLGRRLAIRPDQGVPTSAALPVAGLVFDDTIEPPFGWQGVFDENLYANLALVRILGQMERAGVPTILLYDERTETKPFFPELSALFAHQLGKGPEAEARVARILGLA